MVWFEWEGDQDFDMRNVAGLFLLLFSAGLVMHGDAAAAEVLHVKARRKGSEGNQMVNFRLSLLEKALQASQQRFVIEDCDVPKHPTSDARYALLINDGVRCDLLATASGASFTKDLLLVPVPLYLGGGGYRIFFANRASVKRVAMVKDLDDLRRLRIGSGTFWSDSDIMTDHGLNVVRAAYTNLFSMLEADRFDLLSRSIYEIGGEKQMLSEHPGLVVEPGLLLHYPSDLFFYVSRARPDLQKALTIGMTRLYCNGELQRHIREHPSTRDVMTDYQIRTRTVIELGNQHLSKAEAQALADFVPEYSSKVRVTGASPVVSDAGKFQSVCQTLR